jgi:RNA polymerase sigma factor (sigma-70 family)
MLRKINEKTIHIDTVPAKDDKMQLSDLQLWQHFKNGDEGAFIDIYKKYINLLYNQGIQITYDRESVKDCLQDFFIEFRQRRAKLSDTDNIKLYLLKSFRRRLIAYLKKKSKYFVNDDILKATIYPVELAVDEKLINAQYQQEQLEQLNKVLKELPVKEREALYYYFYQDLSYHEIAEIYKYDHVSSARRLIYNSLKRLKSLFTLLLFVFIQ